MKSQPPHLNNSSAPHAGFWFGLGCTLCGLLYGGIHPISTAWPTPFASSLHLVGFGATIVVLFFGLGIARGSLHSFFAPPSRQALLAILVIILLSDVPQRPFGILNYSPFGISIFLLAIPAVFLPSRVSTLILCLAAFFVPIILCLEFYKESGGRLLFSDDHPAFLFRLIQLHEMFPRIPFYNPLWNGGVEAREFFPSGALNVFFLSWPALKLFDVTLIYNYIVAALLFLLPALSSLVASLLAGGGRTQHACAVLLSVLPSFYLYRWGLSYGTLGFITSVALAPCAAAFLCKLAAEKTLSIRRILAAAAVISLTAMWSLSVLVFLPIVLILLTLAPRLLRQPKIMLLVLLLAVINAPWIVIFAQASNVWNYVVQNSTAAYSEEHFPGSQGDNVQSVADKRYKPASKLPPLKSAFAKLREHAQAFNPLLILLGLPALFLLPIGWRLGMTLGVLWCFCIACAGTPIAPHLELDRFFLFAAALLILPSARGCAWILERELIKQNSKLPLMSASVNYLFRWCAWVCIIAPAVCAISIIRRDTPEKYQFAQPIVNELASAIQIHNSGGRAMFAGFILHELSGGHVAPLAAWSNRPIMASRYQHDRWVYQDIIPDELRKRGKPGVMDFLRLYNVSEVITHERFWRKWFADRPELFELQWRGDRFTIFRVKEFSGSYFLEGSGEIISQSHSSIELKPEAASVLLKFTYYPFLRASECRIIGQVVLQDVEFIRLQDCPVGRSIKIEAGPPWERFF